MLIDFLKLLNILSYESYLADNGSASICSSKYV